MSMYDFIRKSILKGNPMSHFILRKASSAAISAILLAGCATGSPPVNTYPGYSNIPNSGLDRNTVIGAGAGAALGGLVGAAVSDRGDKNEGALAGAALGGVVGGVIGNQHNKNIPQQYNQLDPVLNGMGADVTRMSDGSMKINLAGDATFQSGSAAINENFQNTLNSVARIINESPNTRVLITGHTDRVGNEADNQRLSWARAASVRDYFVNMGISGARIITSGRVQVNLSLATTRKQDEH